MNGPRPSPRVHARRVLAAAGTLLTLALVVAWLVPGVARAQSASERVHAYDVTVAIDPAGALTITETIDYDFGASGGRHGIFRNVAVRFHYDDEHDRVLRLSVLDVQSPTGAPAGYRVEDAGAGERRIRIGDPDRTVEGRHTYVIRYRLEGALNGFTDHDELYLNAIGPGWDVPIDAASVAVTAPGDVTDAACFSGAVGSRLACDELQIDGATVRFRHDGLRVGAAFSVVIAFPKGLVTEPAPILEERWSVRRAFAITPLTVGAALVLFVALAGGIARMVWVSGRDMRFAGSAVDIVFGSPDGEQQRVGLFDSGPVPVEYEPPDGIRPGQVGTLIDERAHPLDVTATIVDLAARGYLRIEEIPKEGLFGSTDWRLHRTRPADDLMRYERVLMEHLFADGEEVLLSDLKRQFSEELAEVVKALYADVVARGWFPRSPAGTRALWLGIGFGVLATGVALTVAAIVWTSLALVPLPLVFAGIALIALHGTMPRRTARGTATLRRVRGFQRFIEDAEKEPARFAERANLFSEYLPYAIVFGCTERWARAFAGLAEPPPTPWYTSSHAFTAIAFASAIDGFSTTSAGMIASTPAGSGSSGFGGGGFSGGGVGGGGGGGW